jgi:hypothetical protein
LETFDGKEVVTALILRNKPGRQQYETLKPYDWEGRWAIVSQDNKGITESTELAVVPFDKGYLFIELYSKPKNIVRIGINEESQWEGWSWKEGKLTIEIDEQQLSKTAGFKIKMN